MNLRKLLIFMLCVLLVFTVFAGCNKTEDTPDMTEEKATATKEAQAAETKEAVKEEDYSNMTNLLELSWIGLNGAEIQDGNYVQKMLEEKFNVKLTNTKITINDEEQMALLLSTGQMPDAGMMYESKTKPAQSLFDEGLTRTISKDFILNYAPDYALMLDSNGVGWKKLVALGTEDEYLALTGIALADDGLACDSVLRLDWLENLGMVPDITKTMLDEKGRAYFSTESIEFDELEAILYAFTNDDPDGNGIKDTYGVSGWGGDADEFIWSSIEGMFGFANGYNLLNEGKLVEWNVSPQYKDYLKLMQKWYADGVLDNEYITLNRSKWREKTGTGVVGWWSSPFNYIDDEATWVENRPPINVLLNNPEAKILVQAPPYGPTGLRGGRSWLRVSAFDYTFFVGADVTDEELARILQIFNYLGFDKEGVVMSRWGEEGVHFKWSGEPYNSKPIPYEGIENGKDTGFMYYNHPIYNKAYLPYAFGSWPNQLLDYQLGEGNEYTIRPYKWDEFNETNFSAVKSEYKDTLMTIINEFHFGAIKGDIDIDAEWDAYVQKWMDNGGDKWTAELEEGRIVADMRNGIFD